MIANDTAPAAETGVKRPRWHKLLLALSLVFLLVTLYRGNYITIPHVFSPFILVASLVALFAAFLAWCFSWASLLSGASYPISNRVAVASTGYSVFGKYIPGKLWTIVGRATYVTHNYSYPLKVLSVLSLKSQVIDLWTGILIGAIGLQLVGGSSGWGFVPLLVWLALTAALFSEKPRKILVHLYEKIVKRSINLDAFAGSSRMLGAILWSAATWALLAIGFYFLTVALTAHWPRWSVGLAFPMAGSLSILVIFVHGGIGVREGLLTGFLTMAGLSVQDAATVAVASRLWYLAGELFIFAFGLLADRFRGTSPTGKPA